MSPTDILIGMNRDYFAEMYVAGIRAMESSAWAAQAPSPVEPEEDIQGGDAAMAAG